MDWNVRLKRRGAVRAVPLTTHALLAESQSWQRAARACQPQPQRIRAAPFSRGDGGRQGFGRCTDAEGNYAAIASTAGHAQQRNSASTHQEPLDLMIWQFIPRKPALPVFRCQHRFPRGLISYRKSSGARKGLASPFNFAPFYLEDGCHGPKPRID